jgi:hypothetical protein
MSHRGERSDLDVLSFPVPDEIPFAWLRPHADWVRIVVEADWLFRQGLDTVDIAAALGLHERDALRAVSQGREARRASEGERWA